MSCCFCGNIIDLQELRSSGNKRKNFTEKCGLARGLTPDQGTDLFSLNVPQERDAIFCKICASLICRYDAKKSQCDKLRKKLLDRLPVPKKPGTVEKVHISNVPVFKPVSGQ